MESLARRISLALVIVLLLPAAAGWSEEGPVPTGLLEDERNTIEVFRRVSESVVFIKNTAIVRDFFRMDVSEETRGSGSGFVWDREGHIVTNYHVLQNGEAFSVTLTDGSVYPARFVGGEPRKDVAVLRIEAPESELHPVKLGDSTPLLVGQKVLAIGNPFGLDQTLTTGVISALGREIQSVARTTIYDVIQTDAPINPGNSGGPLLDSSGRVIGVNTAIMSPSGSSAGIGFAVPINTIARIVPQLIRFGKVKRAGLGILLLSDDIARRWRVQGVIIRQVVEGSPAERAGLRSIRQDRWGRVRSFDLIVGIDDHEVTNYDTLYWALENYRPGDEVEIRFVRDGKEQRARLRLQEV